MTTTPTGSPDLQRLASGRDWDGYLTLENLDAVADRIRDLIGGGQRYTWVAVNELFGYRPEVRTGQTADNIQVWHHDLRDAGLQRGITVCDSYGVWGLHTTEADQRDAEKREDRDRVYLKITRDQVQVSLYTPAGSRLYWVVAVEEREL